MIGIITPYKIANYGTKLQAYAMQQMLNRYDKAEILGFVPGSDRRIEPVLWKIYLKLSRKTKIDNSDISNKIAERNKIINGFDSYYNFGEKIVGNKELKRKIFNYQSVVCGSDQLWAPSNVYADYFTLTLIPDELNKVAYAASFGVSEIPHSMEKKYRKFISRINSVAVREQQGAEIIHELIGREVPVVLDPTLMLDRIEWEALAKNSKLNFNESYIFCYFLGTNHEHRKFATELSKRTGFKLITIPHFKGFNKADVDFGDEQLYSAGPIEFINLIKNAKYVCTDSFHGTVFSIIFHREVAVFERFAKDSEASTNSRIYNLLTSLGMEKSLYSSVLEVEKFLKDHIDYISVNYKLELLKNISNKFLKGALDGGVIYDKNQ